MRTFEYIVIRVEHGAGDTSGPCLLCGVGFIPGRGLLRYGSIGKSGVVSSRSGTLLRERWNHRHAGIHQQSETSHCERLQPLGNIKQSINLVSMTLFAIRSGTMRRPHRKRRPSILRERSHAETTR